MIEILGVSLEGYEILHFVATLFLSEENPKNVVRVGLKIVFKDNPEVKKKNREEKMEIFLKLTPESKINNKEDISYKLKKDKYEKGVGVLYEGVKVARIKEIDIEDIPSTVLNSEPEDLFSYKIIRIDLEVNDRTKGVDSRFGVLIRVDIENEGIESESLFMRAMGLSKYAWNFHTRLWGEYEDGFPRPGRNINPSEEIEAFLIIPSTLYKSFGQINVLPGSYSVHIVQNRDVDSLIIEPPRNLRKRKAKSEEEKIKKWYKTGSLMINWEFEKTHRVSREVIVEHIESFPRLSMFFLLFSLLSATSLFNFLDDIYGVRELGISCLRFKFLLTLMAAFTILIVYIFINLRNYAFHEIDIHTELAAHIYGLILSAIVSVLSLFPLATVVSFGWINRIKNILGEPLIVIGSLAFVLLCFSVLAYKKTKRIGIRRSKKEYFLDSLPISGSLLIAIFVLSLVSGLNFQNIFLLWAYLCGMSTAAILKITVIT